MRMMKGLLLASSCLALSRGVAGMAVAEEIQVERSSFLQIESNAQADFAPRKHSDTSTPDNKVLVIGCGPGGMFFLHALAMKRKKLQDAGDTEALAAMPQVTVVEKASGPGGVWRAHTETERAGSINMYGGLWSNSPSFDMEFFDYTFQDHFGRAMPLYLPRSHLLEYMIARVTSIENVFQHVKFNTTVTDVSYNSATKKFVAKTKDLNTGEKKVDEYDKCVWAGGVQSKPNVPNSIDAMLKDGGFQGEAMHSSDIVDFHPEALKGKRIVLIGDSFSAEDLALQAIKQGVERVYITSARRKGEASTTSTWPGNKAESLKCLPTAVIHNGTGLQCSKVKWDDDIDDYKPVKGGKSVELKDIAAVVYCTGYKQTMRYLSKDLRYKCKSDEWTAPDGWKSQRNSLTKHVGSVEPSSKLWGSHYVCDNIYRHALISNPNMMFVHTITPYYIPEIDALAWALAAYVSGETVLPSKKEMEMRNYLEKLDELQVPYHRYDIDEEYEDAMDLLYEKDDHFLSTSNFTAGYDEYFREFVEHAVKLIARDQVAGGHDGGWGAYDQLSPRGHQIVKQFVAEEPARKFAIVPEETEWRTFRDIDPTSFSSVYTGTKMVPLPGHWMDLDDNGAPLDANLMTETQA